MKNFLLLVICLFSIHSAYGGLCTNITILNDLGSTQLQFMYGLVQGTWNVITTEGSYLEPFFNGTTPPGSTDYIDPENTTTVDEDLITGLVAYFAATEPFACTDSDIPAYTNPKSLKEIHEGIPIDEAAFNTFNSAMLGVLQGMGFSDEDRQVVLDFLESTKDDICTECSFGVALKPVLMVTLMAISGLMF